MKTSLLNDKERENLWKQKEGKRYKMWRVGKPNMRATDFSDNLESSGLIAINPSSRKKFFRTLYHST